MGEAKRKQRKMLEAGHACLFCGGQRLATTEEHCPPRSLFKGRHWPEGFVFPACEDCNGGTSDDDLWVAFLANLEDDPERFEQGRGLLFQLKRQDAPSLRQMFNVPTLQARRVARRLRLEREPGRTYKELGVVNVPRAAHRAVGTLAGKLSKAMYHRATGRVFPTDGGVMFHWFTNAQLREHGRIPALEALQSLASMQQPMIRNGKDLGDQFICKHSTDTEGELHVLQVTFGRVFGFVSMFSPSAGRMEAFAERMQERTGAEAPFTFVSSNDPIRLQSAAGRDSTPQALDGQLPERSPPSE